MTLKKGSDCPDLMGSPLGQEGPASIGWSYDYLLTFTEKKAICKKHIKTCLFCVLAQKQTSFIHIHIHEKYIISKNS